MSFPVFLKVIGIVLKTILFFPVCLVLCFWFGCSDATPARETVPVAAVSGYAHPGPLYHVIIPDSMKSAVVWDQSFPLLINAVSTENPVLNGDTILTGTDPYYSMEMERLEMALNIAEAVGDSFAADSLTAMLSDSSSFIFVISPAFGTIRNLAFHGGTLEPGDTIAVITGDPPDSVYILSPSYFHIRWPENLTGCTVTDMGLQCFGPWPGETTSIPGTWSVQHQFIYEDGLKSFLLAAAGDTIPITIIGSTDSSKIIYSEFALDSISLSPW